MHISRRLLLMATLGITAAAIADDEQQTVTMWLNSEFYGKPKAPHILWSCTKGSTLWYGVLA